MRKEIRSKSKRKWVVGGALFFGGIALLTTGFATWVVGLQITSQDASLGVQVDTAENKSQVFEAVLGSNAGIHLTEQHVKADGEIVGNDPGSATDFSITFSSLKITQGANATKPTYFEVDYSDTDPDGEGQIVNINNKITVNNDPNNKIGKTNSDETFTKVRADDRTYTYIDLNIKRIFLTSADLTEAKTAREDEKIVQWLLVAENAASVLITTGGLSEEEQVTTFRDLVEPEDSSSPTTQEQNAKAAYDTIVAEVVEEFKDATTAGGSWTGTNYAASDVTISELFKWGTYFDGVSPCTYYNAQFAAGKIGSTYDDVDKVYDELNAMHTALSVANGHVVIKLSAK